MSSPVATPGDGVELPADMADDGVELPPDMADDGVESPTATDDIATDDMVDFCLDMFVRKLMVDNCDVICFKPISEDGTRFLVHLKQRVGPRGGYAVIKSDDIVANQWAFRALWPGQYYMGRVGEKQELQKIGGGARLCCDADDTIVLNCMLIPMTCVIVDELENAPSQLPFIWPDILNWNQRRARLDYLVKRCDLKMRVRCKPKLHGTFAGVMMYMAKPGGTYEVQCLKRNGHCPIDNTANGKFASQMTLMRQEWIQVAIDAHLPMGHAMCVCGEWAGKGVQKGDAICLVEAPVFCVFAAVVCPLGSNGSADTFDSSRIPFIYEPASLKDLLKGVLSDTVCVIDWHGEEMSYSKDTHDSFCSDIDQMVQQFEVVDPWVHAKFNKSARGEGVVLYPLRVSLNGTWHDVTTINMFREFAAKAKTRHHQTERLRDDDVRSKTVKPLTTAKDYVYAVVTKPRCKQFGAEDTTVSDDDYVASVMADIDKECTIYRYPGYDEDTVRPRIRTAALEWRVKLWKGYRGKHVKKMAAAAAAASAASDDDHVSDDNDEIK